MNRKRINLAMAFNSNFAKYAYVAMVSLFENAKPELEIHLYVLHSDLTEQDQSDFDALFKANDAQIHYIKIDSSMFPSDLPIWDIWPLEIYYRLMLPELLDKDVDRILYFDADMIINHDLSDLYFMDFEGKLLCATQDPCKGSFGMAILEKFRALLGEEHIYFNSGLLLYNLSQIREKYSLKDYLNAAEKLNYDLIAPDQDLLNYVHSKEVKILDANRYNTLSWSLFGKSMSCEQVKEEVSILHFAGDAKPWNAKRYHHEIEQIWWDYAKKTPYYQEFLEKFQYAILHDHSVRNIILQEKQEKAQLQAELVKYVEVMKKVSKMIKKK